VLRLRSVCLWDCCQPWRMPRPISTRASRRRRSSPTIARPVTSRRGGWPTGGAAPASPASSSSIIRRARIRPPRSPPMSWERAVVRRRRRPAGQNQLPLPIAIGLPPNLGPRHRGRRKSPSRCRLRPGAKDRNRRPPAGPAVMSRRPLRPRNNPRPWLQSRPRPARPHRKVRRRFPAQARPRRRTPIPVKTHRSRATIFQTEDTDFRLTKGLPDPLRLCRPRRRFRPARRLRAQAPIP
jgi:hypothetical protein